ncbi:uncharacterized protein K452DRAFT_256255 [Aplosporella prunicola CBS 121167]|uniref:Uncharacterized protein n=1 Tax=Aplosporella prunicola CBS 121167 TaxID=1176127 RepID=A0A6A6B5V0_9PEZI|nr:uncharacterized protein K452DRAFT_256255 [Aplosporella prunicola CBS 121167]KAF2138624.1 hypothetical protein K452DRAFT_256255 [Aplosporella prunicola CBS 121167]
MPPKKACRFFATPAGCHYGKRCKFAHSNRAEVHNNSTPQGRSNLQGPRRESAPRVGSTSEAELRTWRFQIPKDGEYALPLGPELSRFFQKAAELVASEPETRQAVVSRLASAGGLVRIRELIDRDMEVDPMPRKTRKFKSQYIPFFQTISHPDVLASIVLEQSVGSIYNFLYGVAGQRFIKLASFTEEMLTALVGTIETNDSQPLPDIFDVVLLVFSKVVELNGGAKIHLEIPPIIDALRATLEQAVASYDETSLQQAQYHLSKIQRRLGIGSAIPALESKPEASTTKASFTLSRDLPGSLSRLGRRHDNDYEDIQDIRILPTLQEIMSQRIEYLPTKDSSDWHQPGVQGLLDRNFRLLREDTIGQLRDAIHTEFMRMQQQNNHIKTRTTKQQGLRTYTYRDVNVVNLSVDRRDGLQCELGFGQLQQLRGATARARQEWWTNSRRLQPDALICLLHQDGLSLFCSVCDTTERLKKNEEKPDNSSATRKEPTNLYSHPDAAYLTVRLVEHSDESIRALLRRCPGRDSMLLIEFPGVLLPAFEPTLQALKQMSKTEDIPFSEFLAPTNGTPGGITPVLPPVYSRKPYFRCNLKAITKDNRNLYLSTDGTRLDAQVLQENSSLDEAQCRAVIDSLTRSLALIQGPPGTGKSYTGIALIKILLDNRKASDIGPILCVCYTNHALDQLLEHLVDSGVEQIIRVGSRSKSEALQALNLRVIARKMESTKTEKHLAWEYRTALEKDEQEIQGLTAEYLKAESWKSVREYLKTHYPRHHNQLFGVEDYMEADGYQTVKHHPETTIHKWLHQPFSNRGQQPRALEVLQESPVHGMTSPEREMLYRSWTRQIRGKLSRNIVTALSEYESNKNSYARNRMEMDLRCLQQAQVIGITTSGLARNLELLRRVRTKVMLCEEAGEVLEAHTLTALLPSVEHAILIGDHLQLRPQIQRYDLGREHPSGEQFSLDVSLFERLVQPNDTEAIKLPFTTLETQRRMHPSISQLIRDTLYPALNDAPSTSSYPHVPGMKERLFWFDHTEPEANADEDQAAIATSHTNDFEIEMTTALVSHLMRQGVYRANDIAVITPYLGQLQKLRKRLGRMCELVLNDRDLDELEQAGLVPEESSQVSKASALTALKVATIDNFQGEEAKVVIISLVRSNKRNKCGFLKTSNRINVLLSRAQHGMYVIGNSQTAGGVQMWADVLDILREGSQIGNQLELCCPRHRDKPIIVCSPDDFPLLSPEGGCNQACDKRLRCGHACINKCHSDMLHDAVECLEPCPRPIKGCDHSCPRTCGRSCPEKCTVNVHDSTRTLACGHLKPDLPCWQAQNLSSVTCQVIVTRDIPGCGHKLRLPCYINYTTDEFKCSASCGAVLPCGHTCKHSCSSCKTRVNGAIDTENHGICKQVCGRNYTTCRHSCRTPCHGDKPCPLCDAPCEVQCSHSRCSKKCREPCDPCAEAVCSSNCPHSKCSLPCAAPCDWLPCSRRCEKILSCGHRCPSLCGEKCPGAEYCQNCATEDIKDQQVDYIMMLKYREIDLDEDPCIFPSCGHIMTVANMDGHMDMNAHYHTSPDGTLSGVKPVEHFSKNEAIKVCPTCRGPLRNVARYGRIVRRALLDESMKKFIVWSNDEYLALYQRFQDAHEYLVNTAENVSPAPSAPVKLSISGSAAHQCILIRQTAGEMLLSGRYQNILSLRNQIQRYVYKVRKEEQPFKKVWDLCEDARRRRNATGSFHFDNEVLQTRAYLMASALLIRCDIGILTDVVAVWKDKVPRELRADAELDFSKNHKVCTGLLNEAEKMQNPLQVVEAHVFIAQYNAIERLSAPAETAETLRQQGMEHISTAKRLCEQHPGSTKGMANETTTVEKMLKESTFFSVVTSEERRAVLAAMATEFRGTGHWYYCQNGHPFTVGECGMPMEQTRCPQCGALAGGNHHQPAEGVRHATDLEEELRNLRM